MPFFAFGAMPPRTAVRARAVAGGAAAAASTGCERGREELNESRAAVGLAPIERFHGGISERLAMVGDVPAARVPAALAGGSARDRADASSSCPTRTSSCRGATGRWCWSRRRPRRTPSAGCCARRSRGSPTSRFACWRRRTGSWAEVPIEVPGERGRASIGSATRRRCAGRTWSSATAGTGRWRGRSAPACRCCAARRSATWPRTARGWRGRVPG